MRKFFAGLVLAGAMLISPTIVDVQQDNLAYDPPLPPSSAMLIVY
ncbi:hypothetical protein [Tumebacillus sp. BK434]|nr:hypothetical protein [Tumebacillus sp. BK434]